MSDIKKELVEKLDEDMRSIISHALLGTENNISKETWELIMTGVNNKAIDFAIDILNMLKDKST